MFAFIKGLAPLQGLEERQLKLSTMEAADCHLITNRASHSGNDSYLYHSQDVLACFDGILANADRLIDSYATQGIKDLLDKVLVDQDTSLVPHFYGQFTCMSYHSSGKGIFFCNQIGSGKLYYWHQEQKLVVSSSLAMVVAILRHNGIKCSLDEVGVRMMMAHGFTSVDYTTIAGIKHLQAGKMLFWDNGELSVREYYNSFPEQSPDGLHKAVYTMNQLFREAAEHIHRCDLRHGKRHFAFLSGGMDSRMSVYTALDVGFEDLSVLNYSQSGYRDHKIARKIAKMNGLNFYFYPLDGGRYLLDAHEAIYYNDGQIAYHGAAQMHAALKDRDLSDYGVVMSGQMGDFSMGYFLVKPGHEKPGVRCIGTLPHDDPELGEIMAQIASRYPNQEFYTIDNHSFNAGINGDLVCYQKSHSLSPFGYPPFFSYCLSIDPKLKYRHQLYFKWVNTYQKQAAKLPWEKTGLPPRLGHKVIGKAMFVRRVREKLGLMGILRIKSMHPFDQWLKDDPELAQSLDSLLKNSDTYGVIAASNLAKLFAENISSPDFSIRMSAYTASHSLNKMLGGDEPWIPERFTGGF